MTYGRTRSGGFWLYLHRYLISLVTRDTSEIRKTVTIPVLIKSVIVNNNAYPFIAHGSRNQTRRWYNMSIFVISLFTQMHAQILQFVRLIISVTKIITHVRNMYKALSVASFSTNDMRKQNVIKLGSNASPGGRRLSAENRLRPTPRAVRWSARRPAGAVDSDEATSERDHNTQSGAGRRGSAAPEARTINNHPGITPALGESESPRHRRRAA